MGKYILILTNLLLKFWVLFHYKCRQQITVVFWPFLLYHIWKSQILHVKEQSLQISLNTIYAHECFEITVFIRPPAVYCHLVH